MLTIINIFPIFKKHFKTLKEDTNTVSIILLFFIGPLLGSIILVYFDFLISPNIINSLIATFSILVGFCINILILLLGAKKKETEIENKLVEHLSYNVLYELVIGLFILFLGFIFLIILSKTKITTLPFYFFSVIVYFLVFNFLVTLLMISKRIYALLFIKLKSDGGINHVENSGKENNK